MFLLFPRSRLSGCSLGLLEKGGNFNEIPLKGFENAKKQFHIFLLINLPSSDEVRPVKHHNLRQRHLCFGVIPRKMVETSDKWRTEKVRQVFTMNAALTL